MPPLSSSALVPGLSRRALPWTRPLLGQLARGLAARAQQPGYDLSHVLVVVPTRTAGRRLRETLARAAPGGALLPPRILTPDALLHHGVPARGVGSAEDLTAAWTQLLMEENLADFPALFPRPPAAAVRDAAWALAAATPLARLQLTLAEHAHSLASAAAVASRVSPEGARWADLTRLEAAVARRLATLGLVPLPAAQLAAAPASIAPADISEVLVAGVPDLAPLARQHLAAWSRTLPVTLLLPTAAEADLALAFDEWGRPRAEAWESQLLPVETSTASLHLGADPEVLAARIARTAVLYRDEPASTTALAVLASDPDLIGPTRRALAERGLEAYDPAGLALAREELGTLVTAWLDLATAPTFAAACTVLRQGAVLLRYTSGPQALSRHPTALLAALDTLAARHLPASLADALEFTASFAGSGLEAVLQDLAAQLATADALPVADGVRHWLTTLWAHRRIGLHEPAHDALREGAAALAPVLTRLAALEVAHGLPRAAATGLLRTQLATLHRFPPKPAAALELQGWLEVLFEDAPHLIIAGVNEGRLPEVITGDAFLPDSLRGALGLETNRDRLARDAWLLAVALHTRAASGGRVELLVAKRAADGTPLQPSRLLFRCPEDELVARARQLFAALEERTPQPARRTPWLLQPRAAPAPVASTAAVPVAESGVASPASAATGAVSPDTVSPLRPASPLRHLSVTGFRAYLRCPFRFYLSHVLWLETLDLAPRELDPPAFGTLAHGVLEWMQQDPIARTTTDATRLAALLEGELRTRAHARLGAHPALPVRLQLDTLAARLRSAATVEIAERIAGWETIHTEWRFEVLVAGLPVRGTVDRIDRHRTTGALRVLDYKTTDEATPPADAHLGTRDLAAAHVLPASLHVRGERAARWTDLQLPLYLHALQASGFTNELATAAYFLLPKVQGATTLSPWTDYTRDDHTAALATAEAVVAALAAGRFWPPADLDPIYDDFARLWPDGPENAAAGAAFASVAPGGSDASVP